VNAIYELPFGRGKLLAGGAGRGLDALIGGWQLSGIFRWNTGLPVSAPIDDARWATNFQVQSWTSLTRPLSTCVTKGNATTAPKLFGCDPTFAYQSFRNAYPGETGMRNIFQLPGQTNLDAGLSKSFSLPWSEKQKLQLRWEVFNVANFQPLGGWVCSTTAAAVSASHLTRWSGTYNLQRTSPISRLFRQRPLHAPCRSAFVIPSEDYSFLAAGW